MQYHACPNTNQIAWTPLSESVAYMSRLADKLTSQQEDAVRHEEPPCATRLVIPTLGGVCDDTPRAEEPPPDAGDSLSSVAGHHLMPATPPPVTFLQRSRLPFDASYSIYRPPFPVGPAPRISEKCEN